MSSDTRLVVGLGNPGPRYEQTRHNVGYRIVDAIVDRLRVSSFSREHDAQVAWTQYKNQKVGLAKPLTFMNRSGDAVAPLCEYNNLSPSDLLIIVDDLHLPVGTIRLRSEGSSGGHNGLEHVAQRLGTTAFPRLRIGIGDDYSDGEQSEYVLSSFTPDQKPHIHSAVEDAVESVLTTVRADVETAMNQFN
ncbi:MAG: aminoacyl-tRNA hydrolase [Bacteroidetes bacterium QH_7_62_13]|nr:MAG: aminoacyl-tRNA hydrolase [Bacteroidetes bacterium QH_7_62_13]